MNSYPWTVQDLMNRLLGLDPRMEVHIPAGVNDFGEIVLRPMDDECFHLIQHTIVQGPHQITENILCLGEAP